MRNIQHNFVNTVVILVAWMTGVSYSASHAQSKKEGFVQIFDGKTLNGWEGDTNYWRVENGCMVGEITPDKILKTHSFIIWKGGMPQDFELIAEFRITTAGNSGINYRS